MTFQQWKANNFVNITRNVRAQVEELFKIVSIDNPLFSDISNYLNELNNFTLLYNEQYTSTFIQNVIYEFSANNYLIYEKIKDLSINGGLSEKEDENIKNSYSIGGFDNDNQDLQSGALRNDHSSTSKNKTNNLEIIKKLQEVLLIEKNKLINKIKEIVVAIW